MHINSPQQGNPNPYADLNPSLYLILTQPEISKTLKITQINRSTFRPPSSTSNRMAWWHLVVPATVGRRT
eukprot:1348405-Amorphochlora_amoeboformis.AAC.1